MLVKTAAMERSALFLRLRFNAHSNRTLVSRHVEISANFTASFSKLVGYLCVSPTAAATQSGRSKKKTKKKTERQESEIIGKTRVK